MQKDFLPSSTNVSSVAHFATNNRTNTSTQTPILKTTISLPADRVIVTALAIVGRQQVALVHSFSEKFQRDIYKLLQLKYDPAKAKKPYNLHEKKKRLMKKFLGENFTSEITYTQTYSFEDCEFVVHYVKMTSILPIPGVLYRNIKDIRKNYCLAGRGGIKVMITPSVAHAVDNRPEMFLN